MVWPKNEADFWHREGTSFKTLKAGIFLSKCFKSRFKVESWTPVVRLILITCELLSRVTQGYVVMVGFLKTSVHMECWGSTFLTCFAVAGMLHSPCCFSLLSLPFCASVPIWTCCSRVSTASLKVWQVPVKLSLNFSSTHCLHVKKCLLKSTERGSVWFPLLSQ